METLYDLFAESWNKMIEIAQNERDKRIDEYEMIIAQAKRDIEHEKERLESRVKEKNAFFKRFKDTLDAWEKGIFDFAPHIGSDQPKRLSYIDYANGNCSEEVKKELEGRLSGFVDGELTFPCFTVYFKDNHKMKCLGCDRLFDKISLLSQE